METKIKETLRYLGYSNQKADEKTLNLAIMLMKELEIKCTPKYTYKIVDISISNNEIDFGYFKCNSVSLSKNLKKCEKVVIFATTLGTEADFLIRRYSKMSITKSVIINACASALIEEYCDKFQKEIEEKIIGYLRPRFSAGYGDFSISYQKEVVSILNPSKEIGLTLSENFILMPTKSVTAIIGISDINDKCILSGCELCENINCDYRRE